MTAKPLLRRLRGRKNGTYRFNPFRLDYQDSELYWRKEENMAKPKPSKPGKPRPGC